MCPVKKIKSLVLGGHGDTMVPMPNHTIVDGQKILCEGGYLIIILAEEKTKLSGYSSSE